VNYPLVFMSFGVGILIGLTGMGGAALMAPFLILVLKVRPVTAVGTDLAYGAVTKLVGAWIHFKQDTVDLAVVKRLAMGSLPGGIAGSLLVIGLPRYTQNAEQYVKRGIGALLVLVAIILIIRLAVPLKPSKMKLENRRWMETWGTVIWGAFVGFCVGATSVGSGSMLAPFLLMLYPTNTSRVVGTDVFHGAILVAVTGFTHSMSSGVEWNLIPSLLAGSLPGVMLGSRLATRVPAVPLRTGMAALLLVTGYRML
jgi:uncharacterized membrane protein YfcA